MSESAEKVIAIRGLSKSYKVYSSPAAMLWELVSGKPRHKQFWALKDISFEIARGEVVGIIGRNGAGKSTLLRIIAGTLAKSSGTIATWGSISAILELGTGFNPQYSGRENVIMGGMCLGLTKNKIQEKLDSIIEFSELRDVIDQPFRTYSSGMQARLTFATAMSIDPDILIVDEALATGDAYFVNKCLKRIQEICSSGATVLFVSHSSSLVNQLCSRAIWLERGQVRADGDALGVCKAYEYEVWKTVEDHLAAENQKQAGDMDRAIRESKSYVLGGKQVQIKRVALFDADDHEKYAFHNGEKLKIRVWWEGATESARIFGSFRIDDSLGRVVTGYEGWEQKAYLNHGQPLKGYGCFEFELADLRLGMGTYFLSASLRMDALVSHKDCFLHYRDRCVRFCVRRNAPGDISFPYEPVIHMRELPAVEDVQAA